MCHRVIFVSRMCCELQSFLPQRDVALVKQKSARAVHAQRPVFWRDPDITEFEYIATLSAVIQADEKQPQLLHVLVRVHPVVLAVCRVPPRMLGHCHTPRLLQTGSKSSEWVACRRQSRDF